MMHPKLDRTISSLLYAFALLITLAASGLENELRVTRLVGLEYPWFARLAVIQGSVELVATVSRNGEVQKIRLVSGPEPLAVAAKEAVAKWRFAGCASAPNGCETRVVFLFILRGLCDACEHCPTQFEVDLPGAVKVRTKAIRAIVN